MQIDEKMEAQLRDPKVRRQPMTLGAWADACEMLGKRFREMGERIAKLENELSEAKAKSLTNYEGIWRENNLYQRGVFVTHRGSLWHAEQVTESKPGTDGTWKLTVKSGEQR